MLVLLNGRDQSICGESKTRSAGAGCSQVIEKARSVRTLYRNIDVIPRILFRLFFRVRV